MRLPSRSALLPKFLACCLLAPALGAGCATTTPATTEAPAPAGNTATVPAEPGGAAAPEGLTAAVRYDTVRAGRLDNGKMWTFEDPPLDYLEETYGFRPDSAWLARARLSALRLSGCSAAFVSPNGLVATNHHCARSGVERVSREGENLLDNGFYAPSLGEERPMDGFYVDQLVAIEDVTEAVDAAVADARTDAGRADARTAAAEAVEQRLLTARGGEGAGFVVQVVSLYNGGRYSAYTFRRYTDVRLVAAPELQLGFFGGDADNFTYPRYALDFAFLRVYGDDGRPLDSSAHYFPWSQKGAQPGDAVFVIGNPGSTNRLETVAQLQFRRDVEVEALLQFVGSRIAALEAYEQEEGKDARTTVLSLSNSQKAYQGRKEALQNSYLMARRAAAEQAFHEAIQADPALRTRYGGLFDQMSEVQREKGALGADFGAFAMLTNARFSSATLRRGLLAQQWLALRQQGAPAQALAPLEQQLRDVKDQFPGLDRRYLAAQLQDVQRFLDGTELLTSLLQGRMPAEVAADVYERSALTTAEGTARALDAGTLGPEDPAVRLAALIAPRYETFGRAFSGLMTREEALGARLGHARFDVYGTAVPPDATSSPRFTDGIVRGYPYNGTFAPPHTTFYGLYDRYYSYGPGTEWDLPERWHNPPPTFDRATPLNFVSTSDTIGGNSGSPAVNRDLELVGLNFDRTIEGLSRDFIYLPDRGRNVMVDARAVLEALDDIYDADRIVLELKTGKLVETEAEADAQS